MQCPRRPGSQQTRRRSATSGSTCKGAPAARELGSVRVPARGRLARGRCTCQASCCCLCTPPASLAGWSRGWQWRCSCCMNGQRAAPAAGRPTLRPSPPTAAARCSGAKRTWLSCAAARRCRRPWPTGASYVRWRAVQACRWHAARSCMVAQGCVAAVRPCTPLAQPGCYRLGCLMSGFPACRAYFHQRYEQLQTELFGPNPQAFDPAGACCTQGTMGNSGGRAAGCQCQLCELLGSPPKHMRPRQAQAALMVVPSPPPPCSAHSVLS